MAEHFRVLIPPSGFQYVSASRLVGSGGGAVIYVPIKMEFNLCTDLSVIFTDADTAECLVIELFLNSYSPQHKLTVIICEIYHLPRKSVQALLETLSCFLEKASAEGLIIYAIGDLNINLLGFPNTAAGVDVMNLFISHTFVPMINHPTWITSSSSTLIYYLQIMSLTLMNQILAFLLVIFQITI